MEPFKVLFKTSPEAKWDVLLKVNQATPSPCMLPQKCYYSWQEKHVKIRKKLQTLHNEKEKLRLFIEKNDFLIDC